MQVTDYELMAKDKSSRGLFFDERLIPDIFSFKYPKSRWVKLFLFMEMLLAIIVVLGTLVLVLFSSPHKNSTTSTYTNAQTYSK